MSAEVKGIEPIAFHLRDIFEEHLPTKLASLDTSYADFELPAIQAIYIGGSDGKPVWPSLFVYEENPRNLIPYSGGAYVGYPIGVQVLDVDEGAGFQQLQQRLWRYRRALTEIMHDHKTEPGYWINVTGMQAIASPPIPTEENRNRFAAVKGVRAWFMTNETM